MSKHTPGLWTYGVRPDGSIWLSLGDPRQPGAEHHQGDFFGTEADACLIAAAPELLEALDGMTALFRSICLMKGWNWNDYAESVSARAAIAKATGEQA